MISYKDIRGHESLAGENHLRIRPCAGAWKPDARFEDITAPQSRGVLYPPNWNFEPAIHYLNELPDIAHVIKQRLPTFGAWIQLAQRGWRKKRSSSLVVRKSASSSSSTFDWLKLFYRMLRRLYRPCVHATWKPQLDSKVLLISHGIFALPFR